jgi:class 3 adenylate cyclase/tetratricopeptide (TPR) repeat protein
MCRTENRASARFCDACGTDLRKTEENPFPRHWDPQAYTPRFLIDKILRTRSSVEGERKSVTVLFADVAHYTGIAGRLEPEGVHQIMDGCFGILMDQIHRYEGTINQFTGDGVMALFGAPLAHEDHAHRACLAALDIQKAIKAYGKHLASRYGIDFQMRVGMNSGPVVVGSIGDDLRMDYTAIGDTTNLASRMESMARPGRILLTENTYRIIRHNFVCKSLGKASVRGREEPVSVYRLDAMHEVYRPRLGLERQIYSEMVGRDRELDRLALQVIKAVDGEGAIVNVIGEAGIGKSRLVAELKKHAVMKRVVVLEGRAISMGRNLSFHPIIDVLKNWAEIHEDDTEASSFDKLAAAVRGLCGDEADELLPFLAMLMGMKLAGRYAERVKGITGEALEKLILKSMRDLLLRATAQTPLVIVMEDLHWADTSSIGYLESLFRLAETERIAFVNVFRPDHKETSDRIAGTTKEQFPSISTDVLLQPLDEQNSERLILNMLTRTGLDHPIRRKIIERSGGNPFFMEEVVRSLIDEGTVVVENGRFTVTDRIHSVVIPPTINDVLTARIDRLDATTRSLVKTASVIGRSFFYRILSEVATKMGDLDERLGHLQEIQLIRERRRLEEIEYLFKHALVQEAAYESILLPKRRELHLEVADAIENVFSERLHEFYGMLAFHYSQGEDENKAHEYLMKAGEEALKSSASSEALHYYQEALRLYIKKYGETADPRQVAMIEKNIALALFGKGQYDEAVEHFDRVLAHYGEQTPKSSIRVRFRLLSCVVHFLVALYVPKLKFRSLPTARDNEIIDLLLRKCEALSQKDPKKMVTESFYLARKLTRFELSKVTNGVAFFAAMSAPFYWTGFSFRLSKKILDFSVGKIDREDPKSLLVYEFNEAARNWYAGDWSKIKRHDNELVEENLRRGEVFHLGVYHTIHGYLNVGRGRFEDAQEMVNRLSYVDDVFGNEYIRAYKYFLNVKLLVRRGWIHEALAASEEGIAFTKKVGIKLYYSVLCMFKARAQIRMHDVGGAERTLSGALEHLSEIKALPTFHAALLVTQFMLDLHKMEEAMRRGDASASSGFRRALRKRGRRMLQVCRTAVPDTVEALRLMGTYWWLNGRRQKALKWWKRSILAGQQLGERPELSRTYGEVGIRLAAPQSRIPQRRGLRAEDYLEEARALFKEMDIRWDLEELERKPIPAESPPLHASQLSI